MYYPDYFFSEILPHADSPETLMQSLKLISHGFLNRIKSLKGISMGKSMYYMQEALKEARKALMAREVPVGCVFVDNRSGEIVARGFNRTNELYNATLHAEIVGINYLHTQACNAKMEGKDELSEYFSPANLIPHCTLYVTVEPCIMCAAALSQLCIGKVVFGCSNDKFGGCGSIIDVSKNEYACPPRDKRLIYRTNPGDALHEVKTIFPSKNTIYATFPVEKGLLATEAIELLKAFYARTNIRAPVPKMSQKKNNTKEVEEEEESPVVPLSEIS